MLDFKAALRRLMCPETGSIYAAPNGMWQNGFAANKSATDLHPSVVERLSACNTISYLVPGTSKDYAKGSCVYKVTLDEEDPDCPQTHFLIFFSMAVPKEDLEQLERGWKGVNILSESQVEYFKLQIKFCKGLHV